MALQVVSVAGWFNPFEGVYGGGSGNVSDGAGVLTLDHAVTNSGRQAVAVQLASAKNIQAALVKQFVVESAGDAAGVERLQFDFLLAEIGSDRAELYSVVDADTSKYFWRIRDDASMSNVDGTTLFTFGTKYDPKIVTNIVAETWKWYVDEVEEISVSDTRFFDMSNASGTGLRCLGEGSVHASKTKNEGVALVAYDDVADEPSCTDTGWGELPLNGESATHADYTLGADGGSGNGNPHYTNVDDWEHGDADDSTTWDRPPGTAGETKRQAYTTATFTPTNQQQAVRVIFRHKAGAGTKGATGTGFIYDGTDIAHSGDTPSPGTSWQTITALSLYRESPKAGIAWSDTPNWGGWANLEIGHRTVTDPAENNENIGVTAIHAEVLDIATVTPPTVTSRRRALAQSID